MNFYVIEINPEPWTAPEPNINRGRFRGMRKGAKLKAFQNALEEDMRRFYPDAECIPAGVPLGLTWYFSRDTKVGNIADITNLTKAAEDALQGVLYENDRWVKQSKVVELDQAPGARQFLAVQIRRNPSRRFETIRMLIDSVLDMRFEEQVDRLTNDDLTKDAETF